MSEGIARQKLIDIESVLPILDKISLFGGLSESQLHTVFGRLKKVSYVKGETIFRQGDNPSYIYIVLSGCVRLVFDLQSSPLSAAQLREGACFGETALIGIQPHSATSLAEEDTQLLVLEKEDLMWLSEHEMQLFGLLVLNIAREACRRLYQTEANFLHYLHMHDALDAAGPSAEPLEARAAPTV